MEGKFFKIIPHTSFPKIAYWKLRQICLHYKIFKKFHNLFKILILEQILNNKFTFINFLQNELEKKQKCSNFKFTYINNYVNRNRSPPLAITQNHVSNFLKRKNKQNFKHLNFLNNQLAINLRNQLIRVHYTNEILNISM